MGPPSEITPIQLREIAAIERLLGRFERIEAAPAAPMLRRSRWIKTVAGSVAIEGNPLSEEQVTALLEGKRVVAPPRDILEVENALQAYRDLGRWKPWAAASMLRAHAAMMNGLVGSAGRWRGRSVGIAHGGKIAHVAPPADRVPGLMKELLGFGKKSAKEIHPAILSAVIHYEIEFIHPFEDGNGRMGRLWHSVLLAQYHPAFAMAPVESVIWRHQKQYYRALAQSDACGAATPFVQFALEASRMALESLVPEAASVLSSKQGAEERLAIALEKFGGTPFTRKGYLALHPNISAPTASRDLSRAVAHAALLRTGDKATAVYRFGGRRT